MVLPIVADFSDFFGRSIYSLETVVILNRISEILPFLLVGGGFLIALTWGIILFFVNLWTFMFLKISNSPDLEFSRWGMHISILAFSCASFLPMSIYLTYPFLGAPLSISFVILIPAIVLSKLIVFIYNKKQ
jgi:hypothetical protein